MKATEQYFPLVLYVYYAVQGGFNFWVCGWNPMVWPFKWKLRSSTFLWYCLLCCTRLPLLFCNLSRLWSLHWGESRSSVKQSTPVPPVSPVSPCVPLCPPVSPCVPVSSMSPCVPLWSPINPSNHLFTFLTPSLFEFWTVIAWLTKGSSILMQCGFFFSYVYVHLKFVFYNRRLGSLRCFDVRF